MKYLYYIFGLFTILVLCSITLSCGNEGENVTQIGKEIQETASDTSKIVKTKEQWRKLLSSEAYHVTREGGTERAFTGELLKNKIDGIYHCVCCDSPLFDSKTKFDSGTGWPSYYNSINGKVGKIRDGNFGYEVFEVICNRCDAHLGHVFKDGPKPTGLRYCINSVALTFKKR